MASLSGKTVLITGGSKGIGAAASLLLAKSGANVAINYSSDVLAAEAMVKQIGEDKSIAIKGDAGSLPDLQSIVDQTVKKFGKIDVLIPCAGIMPMRNLEQTAEEDYDSTMRLNVKGPYFLAQVRIFRTFCQYLLLTWETESGPTHAIRLAHHLHLHRSDQHEHSDAKLSSLRNDQRRHRTNDSPHEQGPGQQGHCC